MLVSKSITAERSLAASPFPPNGQSLGAFRRALLRWYDHHHRHLPWRETRDPYRIWLSEIMLQQTRVAAVLEHYRIFLQRFPNIQSLAAASEDTVLSAWSGLGYYRRARMLHRCAQRIAKQHGGCFPPDSKALIALPGIGRYTAAAIASIAFDEPVAVVDGNVERVLQRLLGKERTAIALTTPQTWQLAQELLATSRPGDFNQAMMELGATVCVPGEPRCAFCPVRKWCGTIAQENGAPSARGMLKPPSAPPIKKKLWCWLSLRNGDIRLVQRPREASLMPGMWELPQSAEAPPAWKTASHWRTFRHSITITNYTVHVLRNIRADHSATPRGKWIALDSVSQLPITGLTRKILKADGII
jgi:A/G-specific adenine glycosylase